MKKATLVLIVFLLMLLVSRSAFARQVGEEFIIGESISGQSTAFDPVSGNFLILLNNGSGLRGIFLDSDGNKVNDVTIYSEAVCCDGNYFALTYDSINHRFLAIFLKWTDGGFNVWGQIVNPNGTLFGDNFPISQVHSYQWSPSLTFDLRSGKYLVLWYENRDNSQSIYGQIVNHDGTLGGGEITITENGNSPVVEYGNGNFLAVFYDGLSGNLRGQFISPSGELGVNILIMLSPACCASRGAVVFDEKSGSFLVSWPAWDNVLNQIIAGQLVGFDGTLSGERFPISDPIMFGSVASTLSSQGSFVFWDDGFYGISAREVMRDGTMPVPSSLVSSQKSIKECPGIAGANGHLLLAWIDGTEVRGMLIAGLPLNPTVLLSLNRTEFSSGDKLILTAKIFTPPHAPRGGGNWKTLATLWAQIPNGGFVSIIKPTEILLPPRLEKEVTILNITVPNSVPKGGYVFGARFSDPLTLEELSYSGLDLEIE